MKKYIFQFRAFTYYLLLITHYFSPKGLSNGERIAVVERDLSEIKNRLTGIEATNQKIESLLGWLKWIGGGVAAILLSVVANFLYSFFH